MNTKKTWMLWRDANDAAALVVDAVEDPNMVISQSR
jgi:hypothetical protein